MSEKNNEEEKKTKRRHPIKTFFKVLFSIIFIALIAVIALGIYLGVNIVTSENYSGNEKVTAIASENKDLTTVTSYIMYEAIEDTKDTKEVDLTLDETNMNYLLHALSKKINFGPVNVENLYMYYDTDHPGTYSIYMPVKWLFFQSCLFGTVRITSEGENVDIYVSNLTLGKLSTDNWLIKNIVLRYLNEEYVEKMFSSLGLQADVKISSPNIDIKTTTDEISNLIFNKASGDAIELVEVLYGDLSDNSKITYEFDDKIGVKCNLDTALTGQTYEKSIEESLSTPKANMATLISSGVVKESNASVVWTYLLNGYAMLTDGEKTTIDSLSFSSIGLSTSEAVKAYAGIVDRTYTYQISLDFDIDLQPLLSYDVPDDVLNSLLKKSEIVGSTMAFMNNLTNSFDYIIVEDLYTEFKLNTLYINILLDINGAETVVSAKFDQTSGTGELTCALDTITLGSLTLSKDSNAKIISFLADKVSLDVISFSKDNSSVTINLSSLFDATLEKVITKYNFNVVYTLKEGKIVLSLEKE